MNTITTRLTAMFFGLLGLTLAMLLVPAVRSGAQEVDNSIYAGLLEKHVHGRLVDYEALAKDREELLAYLDILAEVNPGNLSDEARMAYYINVYNAWTLELILGRWPDLESIKDLGGWLNTPWEKDIVRLSGKTVSLDHVEHDILRVEWDEPRIHFAVNCASWSCPRLRAEPYTGAKLDAQLDDQAATFLNDQRFNRLEGATLYVSKLFNWYGEDFPMGAAAYVREYADQDLAGRMDAAGELEVEYLDYDWSLNALSRRKDGGG